MCQCAHGSVYAAQCTCARWLELSFRLAVPRRRPGCRQKLIAEPKASCAIAISSKRGSRGGGMRGFKCGWNDGHRFDTPPSEAFHPSGEGMTNGRLLQQNASSSPNRVCSLDQFIRPVLNGIPHRAKKA
jgi:hypothetical protein